NHCGCGQEAENDTFHVIHTLSVIFSVMHRMPARFSGRHTTSARSVLPPARRQSGMARNKIHAEF
ncbi:hypothetical protein, partial [Mesorhizobium sp. M7A.T.Ca.TU.009.02.1.1]|uniref:hypothetical protein n=1 Tax=Mesorhizobium sp. M7A.T.Ca.TU.009.02.1.1 TaxID=2496791 RepID=UPI0019D0AA37